MRRLPLFASGVGIALLAAVLLGVGALRPLADAARWALLPVAGVFSVVGNGLGLHMGSTNPGELKREVGDLQERLAAVSVDYVKLRSLEEENQLLRETAKFLSTASYDSVGARVIARNTEGLSATILIDRGTNDGLEQGMAVVVGSGVFIGKITSLGRSVSTVTLVSDENSRVAASPVGARRLFGLVQGAGNGVSHLTLVPQSEDLKHNDIVVTAGTEEKVPPDLPIALVDEVQGKATDPFKTATLQPLAQTDQLSLVEVLRAAALRPASH